MFHKKTKDMIIVFTLAMLSILFGVKGMYIQAKTNISNDFSTDITIVDQNNDLNKAIYNGLEETYNLSDRQWQGCPNILVTQKRI